MKMNIPAHQFWFGLIVQSVVKALEMRASWIIPVGPKGCHKCPYEREASGDLTDRGGGDVMTGRVWSDAATTQGTLAATRS